MQILRTLLTHVIHKEPLVSLCLSIPAVCPQHLWVHASIMQETARYRIQLPLHLAVAKKMTFKMQHMPLQKTLSKVNYGKRHRGN